MSLSVGVVHNRSRQLVRESLGLIPQGAGVPSEALGSWGMLSTFAEWDSNGDALENQYEVREFARAIAETTDRLGYMVSPREQIGRLIRQIRVRLTEPDSFERAIKAVRQWYPEEEVEIAHALLTLSEKQPYCSL